MKTPARRIALFLTLVTIIVAARPHSPARKAAGRCYGSLVRRSRYLSGRFQGLCYQLSRRRPDPDATDLVLADRLRSSLGALEKRLDVPRIHVLVEDHIATLHGDVGSHADAAALEAAALEVPGILAVDSCLHVGLTTGESRPSTGHYHYQESDAHRRLIDAAVRHGVHPDDARPVVRGVLATFADRIPHGERDHVASHLPADVRPLFVPPHHETRERQPRTVDELIERILAGTSDLPDAQAEDVTRAVLAELRALVPDEAADVSAILPPDLRAFWDGTDEPAGPGPRR